MATINIGNSNFSKQHNISNYINDSLFLKKIKIKNLYSGWTGESIEEVKDVHGAKSHLRIGSPITDADLRKDRIFFILEFLSYNPVNSQVEKRILYPQRIMSKLYIGQSLEEEKHKDADVFISGRLVVKQLTVLEPDEIIKNMQKTIKEIQLEVAELKVTIRDIYKQDEFINKISGRINATRGRS